MTSTTSAAKKIIELPRGHKIKGILSAGSLCELGYLVVQSEWRLYVYCLTEDLNDAAHAALVMEVEWRFDEKQREMGAITCACFSDDGKYLLTISLGGWLLL